jgi:hypothetical protein
VLMNISRCTDVDVRVEVIDFGWQFRQPIKQMP